jgi:two-component system chemotaxis response regulator CheB
MAPPQLRTNLARRGEMAHRDIVVVGASSGGVEAISKIVAGLPEHFAAAIFVVLHIGEHARSHLPDILNRSGKLPAAHAVAHEPIRRGRIYVAPPGLQTYVQHGRLSVRRGPQENLHRPSIDALFRTAAHHYGPRVVGVVLSGALDDGSAGLLAVKEGGGVTIVQDPDDARVPDMPANAMARTAADYVVPSDEIAALLVSLIAADSAGTSLRGEVPLETVEEAPVTSMSYRSDELGPPSMFTCPDCSGTLFEIEQGQLLRYRCRVGHAFSQETLVAAQNDAVERALWVALRSLEEREALMRRLADNARRLGHDAVADLFEHKARVVQSDVRAVHEVIVNGWALEAVAAEEGDIHAH